MGELLFLLAAAVATVMMIFGNVLPLVVLFCGCVVYYFWHRPNAD